MKLKSLIAALSIFAAAAFMTACSDKDLKANVPAPGAGDETAVSPSAGDDGQAQLLKARADYHIDIAQRFQNLFQLAYSSDFCSTEKVNNAIDNAGQGTVVNKMRDGSLLNVNQNAPATKIDAKLLVDSVDTGYCQVNVLIGAARVAYDILVNNNVADHQTGEQIDQQMAKAKIIIDIFEPLVKSIIKKMPQGEALTYAQYVHRFNNLQSEIAEGLKILEQKAEEIEAYLIKYQSVGGNMIAIDWDTISLSQLRVRILSTIADSKALAGRYSVSGNNDPDLGKKVGTLNNILSDIIALIALADEKLAWVKSAAERAAQQAEMDKMSAASGQLDEDPSADRVMGDGSEFADVGTGAGTPTPNAGRKIDPSDTNGASDETLGNQGAAFHGRPLYPRGASNYGNDLIAVDRIMQRKAERKALRSKTLKPVDTRSAREKLQGKGNRAN